MSVKGKSILITGGSGSIGNHFLDFLLIQQFCKLVIFSNDKVQQESMKIKYAHNPKINKIKFIVGDIRNFTETKQACKGIDIIIHAAAIKHVPESEIDPTSSVFTNTVGGINISAAAIQNGVKKVLSMSTDKAANPKNVMGMTKALQERIFLAKQNNSGLTKFACVRFGNVLGSSGSVTEKFKKQFQSGKPAIVTHNHMTRFIMSIDDAVDLIVYALEKMKGGEIFIKKMPSCKITLLAKTMAKMYNYDKKRHPTYVIEKVRPGESFHEVLFSDEESKRMSVQQKYYVILPMWKEKTNSKKRHVKRTSRPPTITSSSELEKILKTACL